MKEKQLVSKMNEHPAKNEQLISKLALGTVQFGLDYGISNTKGKTNEQEVALLLNLAHQNEILLLDTAQAYGSSEEVIGRNHNERFDIVTKINPSSSETSTKGLVQESLRRLGIEGIYGVLFHNAESALNNPQAFDQLQSLKKEGVIKKIGMSVYKPEELEALVQAFDLPDLVQVPFSHLDRRFENLLIRLHEKGVEIHTRSTFLQGLFFMDPNELSAFFQPVKEYLVMLRTNFQDSKGLAGFLLSYVASRPFIDKVVLGVNNTKQLTDNMAALSSSSGLIELEAPVISENILLPYLWK